MVAAVAAAEEVRPGCCSSSDGAVTRGTGPGPDDARAGWHPTVRRPRDLPRGRYAAGMPSRSPTRDARELRTAEMLSIGSELTVGETRDTNAGEIAAALTREGVAVGRIVALPDRLEVVTDALTTAFVRADLVVSTGGLGPTPDDLARESIAAALGETVEVVELEAWLRGRWDRRGLPMPESNLKQAWRIPSCEPLPGERLEQGWFVRRPDGGVAVLTRSAAEMRPMWSDEVVPRLRERGLGADVAIGRSG